MDHDETQELLNLIEKDNDATKRVINLSDRDAGVEGLFLRKRSKDGKSILVDRDFNL